MKKRIRICGKRCHEARGTRCKCICQSYFHGKNGQGAANRAALAETVLPEELLEQHGFKQGETAYIEQKELPLNV